MAIQVESCFLGHTAKPEILWEKGNYTWLRCPACGLAWVNPQDDDSTAAINHASIFTQRLDFVGEELPKNFSAYQYRLSRLRRYNQSGRLLDVGTFTGKFLVAAQRDGWTDVEGTEVSLPAIEYGRATYGLTIHQGHVLNLDLPPNSYDAITLSDVIEHVTYPLETMQRLLELLRPGGGLYMNTPHFNSIPRYVFQQDWNCVFPDHRHYFSVPNMREALTKVGFKIRYIGALGVLPFGRLLDSIFDEEKTSPSTQTTPQKATQSSILQRNKDRLRPLWLSIKRTQELPFEVLSRLGVHIGAKLVVFAEKPLEK